MFFQNNGMFFSIHFILFREGDIRLINPCVISDTHGRSPDILVGKYCGSLK